jgi:hypothetical protein
VTRAGEGSFSMNSRSGLFRAWLVGSIAWVSYCAWNSDLSCPLELIGVATGAGPWCEFQNAEPAKYYTGLVAKMLGWPFLAGIILLALSWVIAGFRRSTGS